MVEDCGDEVLFALLFCSPRRRSQSACAAPVSVPQFPFKVSPESWPDGAWLCVGVALELEGVWARLAPDTQRAAVKNKLLKPDIA